MFAIEAFYSGKSHGNNSREGLYDNIKRRVESRG